MHDVATLFFRALSRCFACRSRSTQRQFVIFLSFAWSNVHDNYLDNMRLRARTTLRARLVQRILTVELVAELPFCFPLCMSHVLSCVICLCFFFLFDSETYNFIYNVYFLHTHVIVPLHTPHNCLLLLFAMRFVCRVFSHFAYVCAYFLYFYFLFASERARDCVRSSALLSEHGLFSIFIF